MGPLALALTAAAIAGPPQAGVLVPGVSLGGLRLGMTQAQVRAAWGDEFGRCRDCTRPTWYFTYRPFTAQGAAVAFRNGRVEAIYTLWAPHRWRTSRGLRIGDAAARLTKLYGPALEVRCGTYSAFVIQQNRAKSLVYVYDQQVWAFGLSSAAAPACP